MLKKMTDGNWRQSSDLIRLGQVDVSFRRSEAQEALSDHFHQRHELIYIREGLAEFEIDGRPYLAGPQSLVIIGHLEQHRVRVLQCPYARYVLSIENDLCLQMVREPQLLSILLHRPAAEISVLTPPPETASLIESYFDRFIEEQTLQKPFWDTRIALLLMDMLLLVYRQDRRIAPVLDDRSGIQTVIQIQRDIARDFGGKVVLEEIAERHFISKYHLSRLFRDVTGYGFKDYLIRYRLNEAKRLLRESSLSVSAICDACGYGDVNHFIRLFRTHTGTTPLQYRKGWTGPEPISD